MNRTITTRPSSVPWQRAGGPRGRAVVTILGVRVWNVDRQEVARLFASWVHSAARRSRAVFIVNAHTLTLAAEDPAYRAILDQADAVLGDGTGVRWAARLQGVRLRDNLVGTDLLPYLFASPEGAHLRYYLLGGGPGVAAGAAAELRARHPRLDIAGWHEGYFPPAATADVLRAIHRAAPDVLLVAMGNPLQETWIQAHRAALDVPISIGVGGLFDHWSGRLRRAPLWVRELGIEWMQILLQQPHKWRRYVLGNPKFLARAGRDALRQRAAARSRR